MSFGIFFTVVSHRIQIFVVVVLRIQDCDQDNVRITSWSALVVGTLVAGPEEKVEYTNEEHEPQTNRL